MEARFDGAPNGGVYTEGRYKRAKLVACFEAWLKESNAFRGIVFSSPVCNDALTERRLSFWRDFPAFVSCLLARIYTKVCPRENAVAKVSLLASRLVCFAALFGENLFLSCPWSSERRESASRASPKARHYSIGISGVPDFCTGFVNESALFVQYRDTCFQVYDNALCKKAAQSG